MDFLKRVLIGLTVLVSCLAIALLGIAFGTNYWIEAEANIQRSSSESSTTNSPQSSKNSTESPSIITFAHLNFGLFHGYVERNFGYGIRRTNLTIVCLPKELVCMWSKLSSPQSRRDDITKEFYNITMAGEDSGTKPGFFSFSLWVATMLFLVLAIVFGILAALLASYNVITTPIRSIAGIPGLLLWNISAVLTSLISLLIWVGLFYSTFTKNVMSPDDLRMGWISRDKASFGYSFWLILAAIFFFALNCLLIVLSSMQDYLRKKTNVIVNGKPDGLIMLY